MSRVPPPIPNAAGNGAGSGVSLSLSPSTPKVSAVSAGSVSPSNQQNNESQSQSFTLANSNSSPIPIPLSRPPPPPVAYKGSLPSPSSANTSSPAYSSNNNSNNSSDLNGSSNLSNNLPSPVNSNNSSPSTPLASKGKLGISMSPLLISDFKKQNPNSSGSGSNGSGSGSGSNGSGSSLGAHTNGFGHKKIPSSFTMPLPLPSTFNPNNVNTNPSTPTSNSGLGSGLGLGLGLGLGPSSGSSGPPPLPSNYSLQPQGQSQGQGSILSSPYNNPNHTNLHNPLSPPPLPSSSNNINNNMSGDNEDVSDPSSISNTIQSPIVPIIPLNVINPYSPPVSLVSGVSVEVPKSEEEKKQWKRKRIFEEIVETEKSYINSLNTLIEIFIIPLKDAKVSESLDLPLSRQQTIFSNIRMIHDLNSQLYKDLTERLKVWDNDPRTGDLFISFAPYFKIYSQYIENHEAASLELDRCMQKTKFATFCSNAEKDPRAKGNSLASFLIMPIQRIPRYKLLLQSLLDQTSPSMSDYNDLIRSVNLVDSVARAINEAVRQSEQARQIVLIQQQFNNSIDLLANGRVLIRNGPFKRCKYSDREPLLNLESDFKNSQLFLFNDMILIAKSQSYALTLGLGKNRKNQGRILYKNPIQIPLDSSTTFFSLNDAPNGSIKNRLLLINAEHVFYFSTETSKEKAEWLNHFYKTLNERLNNNSLNNNHNASSSRSKKISLNDELNSRNSNNETVNNVNNSNNNNDESSNEKFKEKYPACYLCSTLFAVRTFVSPSNAAINPNNNNNKEVENYKYLLNPIFICSQCERMTCGQCSKTFKDKTFQENPNHVLNNNDNPQDETVSIPSYLNSFGNTLTESDLSRIRVCTACGPNVDVDNNLPQANQQNAKIAALLGLESPKSNLTQEPKESSSKPPSFHGLGMGDGLLAELKVKQNKKLSSLHSSSVSANFIQENENTSNLNPSSGPNTGPGSGPIMEETLSEPLFPKKVPPPRVSSNSSVTNPLSNFTNPNSSVNVNEPSSSPSNDKLVQTPRRVPPPPPSASSPLKNSQSATFVTPPPISSFSSVNSISSNSNSIHSRGSSNLSDQSSFNNNFMSPSTININIIKEESVDEIDQENENLISSNILTNSSDSANSRSSSFSNISGSTSFNQSVNGSTLGGVGLGLGSNNSGSVNDSIDSLELLSSLCTWMVASLLDDPPSQTLIESNNLLVENVHINQNVWNNLNLNRNSSRLVSSLHLNLITGAFAFTPSDQDPDQPQIVLGNMAITLVSNHPKIR